MTTANQVDKMLESTVVGSFSRIGYDLRAKLLPEFAEPLPSLAGQSVLITGATSGIGLAAATALARLGARVHFLARSPGRAEAASHRIAAAAVSAGFDAGNAVYQLADLADLDSIQRFAADFAARTDRLDALIHNAGAIHQQLERTPDGTELTVAEQLIAPFLLTRLLLGPLQAAKSGRVITVSSGGMYTQLTDLTALAEPGGDYSGVTRYALVKRAQVTLASEWAVRAPGTGIGFHAMHPGWVRTPGLAASLPAFSTAMRPLLRTPAQGADTIVWLAAADSAELGTGQFWHDRRPRPVNRGFGAPPDPPGTGRRLWTWVANRAGLSQDLIAGQAQPSQDPTTVPRA
jgi:dehydrogenase/reductase SDR family member 12